MLRTASFLATVGALLAIVGASSPAAAFDTQNLKYVHHEFALGSNDIARGALACPKRSLVVAGGGFFHRPGQPLGQTDAAGGSLMVNTPTTSGHGWLAIGQGSTGEVLAITIFCLSQAELGGPYTVNTKLLTPADDSTDPTHYQAAAKVVGCPAGDTAVTGGAGWYSTAKQDYVTADAEKSLLASDSPITAGAWWAAGYQHKDDAPVSDRLRETVMCRPNAAVGTYSVAKNDVAVASSSLTYGFQQCPANTQIVAGGAYWHIAGQSPANSPVAQLQVTALAPETNKSGMWVAGYDGRFSITHYTEVLTEMVECRPI
jgi:hypothetical protein